MSDPFCPPHRWEFELQRVEVAGEDGWEPAAEAERERWRDQVELKYPLDVGPCGMFRGGAEVDLLKDRTLSLRIDNGPPVPRDTWLQHQDTALWEDSP